MSISPVTHKTTVFNGSVPKPQPIFTSIKPVITHEKNTQSASIRVDQGYHVDVTETRALKLLQDIKKFNVKRITLHEPKFSSSFTREEVIYLITHFQGLGITVIVVHDDDALDDTRESDVFTPKTPPRQSAPPFPEIYPGEQEPYDSLQALDDHTAAHKASSIVSASLLPEFFSDKEEPTISPKINALFKDVSWFLEITDSEYTQAELEQIQEICDKKEISLFHKMSL
jgi:hypothetical protein